MWLSDAYKTLHQYIDTTRQRDCEEFPLKGHIDPHNIPATIYHPDPNNYGQSLAKRPRVDMEQFIIEKNLRKLRETTETQDLEMIIEYFRTKVDDGISIDTSYASAQDIAHSLWWKAANQVQAILDANPEHFYRSRCFSSQDLPLYRQKTPYAWLSEFWTLAQMMGESREKKRTK